MCNVKTSCLVLLTWTTFLVSQTSAGKLFDCSSQLTKCLITIEPRAWLQNTVTPRLFDVGEETEIEWRFMSPQQVRDGDCITVQFVNPYAKDAPGTYTSFTQRKPFSCEVSLHHF